jgi:aspartyl-tRNA(Asn)/glutamyl-tRNA(Gln) amidotransferase subunit B
VRKPGAELGTRREIKNLNSFKFMQQAIDFEIRWQVEQIEDGKKIQQATVLFDPDTGETRAMRTKEDAADYRYFPDPDLPPLHVAPSWVQAVKTTMPELPRVMAQRYLRDYGSAGLTEYDASALTQSKGMMIYFQNMLNPPTQPKQAANWLLGEVSRRLNQDGITIDQIPVKPEVLGQLVRSVYLGIVSNNAAKQVLDVLWSEGGEVDAIIEAKGLKQINDSGALEKIIDEVLAANPDNVTQFKAGKDKAVNALVGQAMKASKGKANPQQVNDMLRAKLAAA